jgi:hypothetical protein
MFFMAVGYYFLSLLIPAQSAIYQILFDLVLLATFPLALYLFSFFRSDEVKKIKEITTKVKSLKPSDMKRLFYKHFYESEYKE